MGAAFIYAMDRSIECLFALFRIGFWIYMRTARVAAADIDVQLNKSSTTTLRDLYNLRVYFVFMNLCASLSPSLYRCLCPSSACNRKFNKCATRSKAQLMRRQITLRRCRLRLRISCGR